MTQDSAMAPMAKPTIQIKGGRALLHWVDPVGWYTSDQLMTEFKGASAIDAVRKAIGWIEDQCRLNALYAGSGLKDPEGAPEYHPLTGENLTVGRQQLQRLIQKVQAANIWDTYNAPSVQKVVIRDGK